MSRCEKGHVLLASLMLIVLLGIASMTALYLASQDGSGVSAMKEDTVAQQVADAGADFVMSWFHDPVAAPDSVAGLLVKRQEIPSAGRRSSMGQDVRSLSGRLIVPMSSSMRQIKRTIRRSTIRQAASPMS